jgi:hypothetical protein
MVLAAVVSKMRDFVGERVFAFAGELAAADAIVAVIVAANAPDLAVVAFDGSRFAAQFVAPIVVAVVVVVLPPMMIVYL